MTAIPQRELSRLAKQRRILDAALSVFVAEGLRVFLKAYATDPARDLWPNFKTLRGTHEPASLP